MAGFCFRLAIVLGERISAKIKWSSSHTLVVPFGDKLGLPSGQTVATKPSRCSRTTRFISSVKIAMDAFSFRFPAAKRPHQTFPKIFVNLLQHTVKYILCHSP